LAREQTKALLFEILRSFTTLADTLNLSRAVEKLGTTRQTVRRHIELAEDAKGAKLFEVENRSYRLTDAGKRALHEAEHILMRGEAWLRSVTGHEDDLYCVSIEEEDGFAFYSQQQPLQNIWTDADPLLRDAFGAWFRAEGSLDHAAFLEVRPSLMVYRPNRDRWIVTEVGESSSMAQWFGRTWARSAVGRELSFLPGGRNMESLLSKPFEDVRIGSGPRYEHIVTLLTDGESNQRTEVAYQRLLLGGRFPDDSFAMISATRVSKTARIRALEGTRFADLAEKTNLEQ